MSYSPAVVDGDQTLTTIAASSMLGTTFQFAAPAAVAYPLANLALYVPFSVSETVTAYEGWVVTGTLTGDNFDIGIYSAAGVRLTSSGANVKTASVIQNTTAMTDQVLVPNTRYYMAFACNGTGNYFAGTHGFGIYEAMGVLEATTSYVLPTNPTLSRTTRAYLPHFGLNLYTVAL